MTNNCCNPCDPCKKKCCDPCGCPLRVLSVCEINDKPGVVEFNLDGKTVDYDFSGLVARTETDTNLRVDSVARVLRYSAERHVNNITAKQLGSILHIADIGDVDITGVTDNSLFVYQKQSDCGQGCDGIDNSWVAWNSDEHLEEEGKTVMVFDDNGAPKALRPPTHTDQYYSLMWRGGDKVGYTQPVEVASPSTDTNGYSYLMFVNPTTKQLEMLKVVVSIDGSGHVTFDTNGGA